MEQVRNIFVAFLFVLVPTILFAQNNAIVIDLKSEANLKQLTMGDKISFKSSIKNNSNKSINGLVGWISLVEITKGHEQPMDLEDWSAHKAISRSSLKPGETLITEWPMRLIRSGDYRVFVSITSRDGNEVFTSPTIDFHVNQKPVISSYRVLFVAFGIPLILLITLIYRRKLYKNRKNA